jgi:hypothetical protein
MSWAASGRGTVIVAGRSTRSLDVMGTSVFVVALAGVFVAIAFGAFFVRGRRNAKMLAERYRLSSPQERAKLDEKFSQRERRETLMRRIAAGLLVTAGVVVGGIIAAMWQAP